MDEINDGLILIVDDDPIFLKITGKILGKAFKIETAVSGFDALKLIDEGFSPQVILSDQRMPGMDGAEFLKRSMEKAPQAVRVIITASPDPRDIIRAINDGHAYMFLTKPFENLELFQSVKLAMDHYKDKVKYSKGLQSEYESNNEKIKSLNEKIGLLENELLELKKTPETKSNISQELTLAFSEIIRSTEKFYFTDHTFSVTMISKTIGQALQLSKTEMQNLLLAAMIHNVVTVAMPNRFKAVDPNELNLDDKSEYFKYFNSILKILARIEFMKEAAKIIAQMWEHSDGSGSPNGFTKDQISRESQILQMANIFHNYMYAVKDEKSEKLRQYGVVFQTRAESNIKHKNIVKYFFRNTNWFDYDVFLTFQDLIKDKELQYFQPVKKDLEIDLKDYFGIIDGIPSLRLAGEEEPSEVSIIDNDEAEDDFKEVEIDPIDVRPGMKTVYAIRSKNGVTVVPADKEISSTIANTICEMVKAKQISNKITVMVPKY